MSANWEASVTVQNDCGSQLQPLQNETINSLIYSGNSIPGWMKEKSSGTTFIDNSIIPYTGNTDYTVEYSKFMLSETACQIRSNNNLLKLTLNYVTDKG